MNYALSIPNFGEYGDPRVLVELAQATEQAGWDGLFVWDHINQHQTKPMTDPWVALTAMAMATTRIRIGPMVTPVARRRPWKLAREAVSLDHLSHGRLTLGVGLGWAADEDFEPFGEAPDAHIRAQKLDEGLAILDGLWRDQPFSFTGKHFQIKNVHMQPTPVQRPRIPIWVAGIWPNKAPFRRAAQWDGVFPGALDRALTPEEIQDIRAYIAQHRTQTTPFDIFYGYATSGQNHPDELAQVARYHAAGVTWWLDGAADGSLQSTHARIRLGPPTYR